MRKTTIVLTWLALLGAASAARAAYSPQATAVPGSVPSGVNYQGRLEESGLPVTGSKSMTFRVFDAAAAGAQLWTSGAQSVSVSLGLFNTVLAIPESALTGGGGRWLEVTVEGTVLSPREPLNAVPYAMVAKTVEGTIDVSGGGLQFLPSAGGVPALFVASGTNISVGIATASPSALFTVGASSLVVTRNGFIGMGTSQPSTNLEIIATGNGGEGITIQNTGLGTNAGANLALADGSGGSGFISITQRNVGATGNPFFSANASYFRGSAANGVALVSQDAAAPLTFQTGNVSPIGGANERMRIDSTGQVGIGTTAPGARLHIAADASVESRIASAGLGVNPTLGLNRARGTQAAPTLAVFPDVLGNLDFRGYDGAAYQVGARIQGVLSGFTGAGDMPGALSFLTTPNASVTPVERMRISDGGGVSFMTSGISAINDAGGLTLDMQAYSNAQNAAIYMRRFRAASASVQDNDILGEINFNATDGAVGYATARVSAEVDGVTGSGDLPSRLVFETTPDAGTTKQERMRIDNAGNVGIGTAGPGGARLEVEGGDAAVTTQGNGLILRATDGATCYRLTVNNAGALATGAVACP